MTRFTVICTSDFNLFNRWFSGEDITPILEQRQAIGFNAVRVWTAYDIPLIGTCDPRRSGFYDGWPDFMGLLSVYGLYAEVTAFTGPYPYFPTQDAMVAHWDALGARLRDVSNLLDLEAVNEGDNGPNLGVPLNRLRRPVGILSSHGSAVQDAAPMQPPWDVAGYRAPFEQWWRKTSHNAMEWADSWGIPVWTNEFPRSENDPTIAHWEDAGEAGALLCAGAGCHHSPEGKNSTLFGAQTRATAEAFVRGAKKVPLEYQAGFYRHRNDLETPGILRAYSRTLPDGREYIVRIRA